jgi:predicted lipoprotein with Yx(FWY)xxD motif
MTEKAECTGSSRPTARATAAAMGVAAVVALGVLAGCSSSPSSSTTSTTGASSATTAASSASSSTSSGPAPLYEVTTGKVHGLGTVLVDGQGFTLYLYVPDHQSGNSVCNGSCALAWPPLILPNGVSAAVAGSGVKSSLLGTTKRSDGSVQVTYNRWPLYTWQGDSTPGQATGQGINNSGGLWYVLSPSGAEITAKAS